MTEIPHELVVTKLIDAQREKRVRLAYKRGYLPALRREDARGP